MTKDKRGKVVIADDNKEICQLVKDVLSRKGCEVDVRQDNHIYGASAISA